MKKLKAPRSRKKKAIRETPIPSKSSYLLPSIVFLIVALIALERTAYHFRTQKENLGPESIPLEPATLPQVAPASPSPDNPWGYFHPTWKARTGWSFTGNKTPILDKSDTSAEQIRKLVNDPDGRLDPEFKVPPYLKERVLFWMEVYSRYNSRIRIVHDRITPSIVYGIIDFRPLYRTQPNAATAEAIANGIERKVLKTLKEKLQEAIGISHTNLLSAEEKNEIQSLLSRIGAASHKDTARFIENMRTQSGQSDMFLQALYRARNLLPHIESVFKQSNLPGGLGRIPFVESSFNVKAQSKDGAVGIWQFMPETARQMIHKDEEKLWSDPLRQTKSAAKILTIYRSLLPDWGTTITSYNSGVGRIRRMVEKYKIKDVEGLLSLPAADGLGFAGKNFFAEFLAANIIEAYKNELFEIWLEPSDSSLVFRGVQPFPKSYCDL